jgi:hypothetical protein
MYIQPQYQTKDAYNAFGNRFLNNQQNQAIQNQNFKNN